MAVRSVVFDTETTGMPVTDGHRVIEIGCVELMGRRLTGRNFHVYVQPDRPSDEGAIGVHGITDEFLVGKPRFAEVADELYEFIQGAQIIAHNATFDVGLAMARERHPGQRNSLDALCKRYGIDNSGRELHGALLDSEILADVYLAMTGGQTSLSLAGNASDGDSGGTQGSEIRRLPADRRPTTVIRASQAELDEHMARLQVIAKAAGDDALWTRLGL
jgi:DNA polymerase-3 subunit epsilon